MNKQPEVTEATRKNIIEAFWRLFKDTPVEKITAAMLASEAGIHRSSFYRYFTDIYQVLDAFQTELLDYIRQEVTSIQSNTDFTLPEYTEKVSTMLTGSADKIYRMMNYKGCDFRERFIENIKPNLVKCVPVDQQSKDSDYYTAYIIQAMLFNFNYWYENKERYDLKQVNALGQKILLNGIPKQ